MRSPKRLFVAAVVAVGAVAVPWFAAAQLAAVDDPGDVKGLLDIRRVEVHGRNKPRFTTLTYPRWSARRIWDRGYDIVYLDARGDEHFEHYALVYSDGGRMRARLFRDRRKKPDYVVARLKAWKPSKRSVVVKVPLARLGIPEKRAVVLWYVKTLMTGRHCPRVCVDRAPNSGAAEFLVPAPTPTSSPSFSPTPIPPEPEPSP